MKITYAEWSKKYGLSKDVAINLLHRKILKDKDLKKRMQKKPIKAYQWWIDEELRPIKTSNGKWLLV